MGDGGRATNTNEAKHRRRGVVRRWLSGRTCSGKRLFDSVPCSNAQAYTSSRPPGRSSLAVSVSALRRRASDEKWCSTAMEMAASKTPDRNGTDMLSQTQTSKPRSAHICTKLALMSQPTTSCRSAAPMYFPGRAQSTMREEQLDGSGGRFRDAAWRGRRKDEDLTVTTSNVCNQAVWWQVAEELLHSRPRSVSVGRELPGTAKKIGPPTNRRAGHAMRRTFAAS